MMSTDITTWNVNTAGEATVYYTAIGDATVTYAELPDGRGAAGIFTPDPDDLHATITNAPHIALGVAQRLAQRAIDAHHAMTTAAAAA